MSMSEPVLMRRCYPAEFKDRAADLCLHQGYSHAKAAQELGVPVKTLANWVRDRRRSSARLPVPVEADDPVALKAQIRELQKQLARAEMEKEILKKATAYFAKESL